MKAVRACCYPESDRALSNLNVLDSCFQTKLEKNVYRVFLAIPEDIIHSYCILCKIINSIYIQNFLDTFYDKIWTYGHSEGNHELLHLVIGHLLRRIGFSPEMKITIKR
jgi:hypothetical protein